MVALRYPRTRTKEVLPPSEKVLLIHNAFTPGYSYVRMPTTELEALDSRGRYVPIYEVKWLKVAAVALIAGLSTGGVTWFVSIFALLMLGMVIPVAIIPFMSLLAAGVSVYITKKLLRTEALWVLRLHPDGALEPVYPKALLHDYIVDGDQSRPFVYRGPMMRRIAEGNGIRFMVKLRNSNWQRIQFGALAALGVSLAILLVMFALATQSPGG